uniref:Uncharacterized protein n=1 Tax=Opuntia streptacantha TaxID=393608 RepID=A0A7C8YEI3_OPUST
MRSPQLLAFPLLLSHLLILSQLVSLMIEQISNLDPRQMKLDLWREMLVIKLMLTLLDLYLLPTKIYKRKVLALQLVLIMIYIRTSTHMRFSIGKLRKQACQSRL